MLISHIMTIFTDSERLVWLLNALLMLNRHWLERLISCQFHSVTNGIFRAVLTHSSWCIYIKIKEVAVNYHFHYSADWSAWAIIWFKLNLSSTEFRFEFPITCEFHTTNFGDSIDGVMQGKKGSKSNRATISTSIAGCHSGISCRENWSLEN